MRRFKDPSAAGKASQREQTNERLKAALRHYPKSYSVFQIATYNPRTGAENYLEIKHEDRGLYVYLNGKRWQKPWSKWGFCRWLFDKIDNVASTH